MNHLSFMQNSFSVGFAVERFFFSFRMWSIANLFVVNKISTALVIQNFCLFVLLGWKGQTKKSRLLERFIDISFFIDGIYKYIFWSFLKFLSFVDAQFWLLWFILVPIAQFWIKSLVSIDFCSNDSVVKIEQLWLKWLI